MKEGIHQYLIDNELLLYAEVNKSLYGLNSVATAVWFLFEDGLSEAEIVKHISSKFSMPINQVAEDVSRIFSEFNAIVQASEVENRSGNALDTSEYGIPLCFSYQKPKITLKLKILETCFCVRFDSKLLFEWIWPIVSHLQTEDVHDEYSYLDIIETRTRGFIIHQNRIINSFKHQKYLAPVLIHELSRIAYQKYDYLLAIHSAVAGNKRGCILLPGMSGKGKSTLVTALVHSGLDYYTDEVAVINRQTQEVVPLPTPIGIKKRSLHVLDRFFPQINKLEAHYGEEGKEIRYLVPDKKSIVCPIERGGWVSVIIFPEYQDGASTVLKPISKVTAIKKLVDSGYQTKFFFNALTAAEIIDWITSIKCFSLHYSNLKEAVDTIREVFNEP